MKLQLFCSRCGEKIYEYTWIRENYLDYHQECFNKMKKEREKQP